MQCVPMIYLDSWTYIIQNLKTIEQILGKRDAS